MYLISKNETPRPHDDYYLAFILKMAAAAMVELPEATQSVYLERLRNLSAIEIQTATARTIEEWTEPSKMAPLPFILDRTAQRPAYMENRELLDRADKPPNWKADMEPASSGAEATLRALAKRQGNVTPEEIAEWLEGGKRAQREHNARLEADPAWQAWAAQFGGKVPTPDEMAKRRNDSVPYQPSEDVEFETMRRRQLDGRRWAKVREPGEEG